MRVYEQGVLPQSGAYVHQASPEAKRIFFYLLCAGHYVCDPSYCVHRTSYESFLLLYVCRGSGYMLSGGAEQPLAAGTLALIDCYSPHTYGTHEGWEILWAHVDGALARAYYDEISSAGRCVIQQGGAYIARKYLSQIITMYKERGRASEPLASQYIVGILTQFLCAPGDGGGSAHSSVIDDSVAFISEHIDEPIQLEELARRAAMSAYHFSRVFKRETGTTPHQFIIDARMNAAKFLLSSTSRSVREIAYNCGYGSDCVFCTVFKKLNGCTPQEFRRRQSTKDGVAVF